MFKYDRRHRDALRRVILGVDEKDDEKENKIEKKTEKVAKVEQSRQTKETGGSVRTSERMDSYNSSEKKMEPLTRYTSIPMECVIVRRDSTSSSNVKNIDTQTPTLGYETTPLRVRIRTVMMR